MPAKNASISGHTNAIARLNTPTLVFADGPSAFNGTYTIESHNLITTILKDEWGFDGLYIDAFNENGITSGVKIMSILQ